MKNLRDKERRKGGFTLAEMLLTVALVGVLMSVIAVSANSMIRSGRQASLDRQAQQLYAALSRNAMMLSVSGRANVAAEGLTPLKDDADEDKYKASVVTLNYDGVQEPTLTTDRVYYRLSSEDRTERAEQIAALMPVGSVSDELYNGEWIITYRVVGNAASIANVFYSRAEDVKGGVFVGSSKTFEDVLENPETYASADVRQSETNGRIGYYGGDAATVASVTDAVVIQEPDALTSVLEEPINAEKLMVGASCVVPNEAPYAGQDVTFVLTVEGVSSGNAATLRKTVTPDFLNGQASCSFTLDSLESGKRFKDVCAGLLPGEDLILSLSLECGGETVPSNSPPQYVNSLFASVSDDTSDPATDKDAIIKFGRHLQNLDAATSGVDIGVLCAVQEKAVDFSSSSAGGDDPERWLDMYPAAKWTPISNAQLKAYDGGGREIRNLPATVNGGAVGLFGEYSGSEIRNVALVNPQGINGGDYAGGLVGKAKNALTIDNCGLRMEISPFTEKATAVKDTWLAGAQFAGGLVGKADAALTIQRSYAATVVSAGTTGIAGGLVGQADGALTVKNAYADCYVAGKTIGGLAGNVKSNANFEKCFSAGFALGAASIQDAGAFYAAADNESGVTIENTCYTVFNFTDIAVTGDKVTDNGNDVNPNPAKVDEASAPEGNYYGLDHERANTQLNLDEMAVYPYSLFGLPAHYGDWRYDAPLGLNVVATNGDKLYVTVSYHDESRPDEQLPDMFYIAVSGEKSKFTKFFQIDVTKDPTNPTAAVTSYKTVSTGTATSNDPLPTGSSANEDTASVQSLYAGIASASYDAATGYTVKFTLDDITINDRHFADLFVGADGTGKNFIPGEYLTIRAYESRSMTWKNLLTNSAQEPAYVNSLFSDKTDADGAILANTRHLQNLDPSISNVPTTGTHKVDKAKLQNDIAWNASAFSQIYAHGRDNEYSIVGSFYGIYNPALTLFEGQEFTLSGYVINAAPSVISADGAGNAGLFRLVTNELRVQNLRMSGFSVTAAANKHAGTLAAEVGKKGSSEGKLTIRDCLADSFGVSGDAVSVTASGTLGSAGGLVGAVTGCELSITNSAASVRVKSAAAAGGLIGSSNDKVTIAQSYVGGHTTNGKYVTANATDYNIVGGTAAGGFIGRVDAGDFSANQSFSAASVAVTSASGCAGGLIGYVNGDALSVRLGRADSGEHKNAVYVIAPVHGADGVEGQPAVTYDGHTGAVLGKADKQVINANSYYLPEIYKNCVLSGATATNIRASGNEGDLSAPAHLAYYDRDDGNGIAARDDFSTMEIKTFPYDAKLNNIGKEFPFSVWTNLSFDGFTEQHVYYGDWQAVLNQATVAHELKLLYVDNDDHQFKTKTSDGWTQTVLDDGHGYNLLLPALGGANGIEKAGYHITGWYLMVDYDESAKTGHLILSDEGHSRMETAIGGADAETKAKNGDALTLRADATERVWISSEYISAYGDLYVFAVYTPNTEEYAVTFRYPEFSDSGAVTSYQQLGQSWAVKTNQETDASDIAVPSKTIVGYRFLGWSYDEAGNQPVTEVADGATPPSGQPFIQNGKMTIPKELITSEHGHWDFYAQYRKIEYGTIAIDFLYHVQGSDQRFPLSSTEKYREQDDAKQYQIQFVRGLGYHDYVTLPVNKNKYHDGVPTTQEWATINSAWLYQYDAAQAGGSYQGALVSVDNSVIQFTFPDETDKSTLRLDTVDNDAESIRLVVLYEFPAEDVGGTVKCRVQYKMGHTSPTSTADNLLYNASADAVYSYYPDSVEYPYYPDGKTYYEIPRNASPSVTLTSKPGWTRQTNSVSFTDLQEDDNYPGDYKIVVEYDRQEYRLTFDSSGGTYIEEQSRYFGEPFLRDGKLTASNPTRTGYEFDDWSLHKKGETSVTYGLDENMPPNNVEASASWNAVKVKYRVMYWTQNANDNEYTYAGGESKEAYTDTLTDVTGEGANFTDKEFFHLRESASAQLAGKTYSLVNGVQTPQAVQGDGSTIVNVFYDRNLYTLRFLYGRMKPDASSYAYSAQSVSNLSEIASYGANALFVKVGNSYYAVTQYTDKDGNQFYGYEPYASGSEAGYVPTTATPATSSGLYGYVAATSSYAQVTSEDRYDWQTVNGSKAYTVYTRSGNRYTNVGTTDPQGLKQSNGNITAPSSNTTYYYAQNRNSTTSFTKATVYVCGGSDYSGPYYVKVSKITESNLSGLSFYTRTASGTYQVYDGGAGGYNADSLGNSQHGLSSGVNFDGIIAAAAAVNNGNTAPARSLVSTVLPKTYSGTTYDYYYLDLTARYEQDIKDMWPDMGVMVKLESYSFVSWVTAGDSNYRAIHAPNNNGQLQNSGDATIKGQYATMSKEIIGKGGTGTGLSYSATTADNGGIAHILLGRYQSSAHHYTYEIYRWNDYEGTAPTNANGYTASNSEVERIITYSNSNPNNQTAPIYEGYYNTFKPTATSYSATNGTMVLKFTYLPYKYKIAFYNVFDQTTQDVLTTSYYASPSYYFNESITNADSGVQLQYNDGTAVPTVTENGVTAQSTQDAKFVGWSTALGATSAEMRYNKEAVTMPAGSTAEAVALVLYPIMEPYQREVSFNLNYDTTDAPPASVTLNSGANLESLTDANNNRIVVNTDGTLTASYKPVRAGDATHTYEFVGWFQDAEGQTPFALSEPIHADMTLYAKWDAVEKIITHRDVIVKYVQVEQVKLDDETYEERVVAELGSDTETYQGATVGATLMIQPKEFEGLYPEVSVYYHTVLDSSDPDVNTVTFKYSSVKPWDYYVEYYIRCRSYMWPQHDGWNDVAQIPDETIMPMGENSYKDYLIGVYHSGVGETDVYKSATHQYETVEFKMPATPDGYEDYEDYYHFLGYSYNAEEGAELMSTTTATIDANYKNDPNKPLKFYIEPDPDSFGVLSWNKTYDGEEIEGYNEREADVPATPTVTATILDAYCYMTKRIDGTWRNLAANEVVDAGLYSVNAYALLKMEETNGDETTTDYYVLWMDESGSLNLRIGRRPVTISSVSASKRHDGQPLTTPTDKLYDENGNIVESGGHEAVYVSSGNFVQNQGFDYAFSVEAFRMEAGVSDNSFTPWLSDGAGTDGYAYTNPDNYDITIVYGTLRVYYEITFAPKLTDDAEQNALEVSGSMATAQVPAAGQRPSTTLTYKLPACAFTPPEGWEFEKWIVDGSLYNENSAITITKHTTVTAKWKQLPEGE